MPNKRTDGGVVYLLTCKVSGKQYVGQSWCYEKRMVEYKSMRGKNQNYLNHATNKYGWDNFTTEILERGIETQEALDATEAAYIKSLNTMSPHGYNLTTGGKGGKCSAEMRDKMSKAQSGEKNHFYGKSHSPESRKKQSDAMSGHVPWNKGKPHSRETRDKMSELKRGENNPMFGKKQSIKTRTQMRASAKAWWAEHRRETKQNTVPLL